VGTNIRLLASNTNVRSFRPYLIAVAALAIGTAGCSSSRTTGPASHSVTTTATHTRTVTTTPHAAAGLTAEQMDAHLGVGVPKGWVPVDFGDARVWVPGSWYLGGASCISGQSPSTFMSVGTETTVVSCDIPQSLAPTQDVELATHTTRSRPIGAHTIHGYRVYDLKSPHAEWNLYEVPELSLRIATRGSLGPRILNTLGPSAHTLALNADYQLIPSTWRKLTEDNVVLDVPPTWTAQVDNFDCSLTTAQVTIFRQFHGVAACGSLQGPPRIAALKTTTVWMYLSPASSTLTPTRNRQPITTLHHGTTTISVYTGQYDPNALDLFVRKARSKITHVLTLWLGRDGRVAGGVLGSVRATT